MKRAIVIPDIYVPYHDMTAIRVIVKVIKALEPDYLIVLGDSLDFYQLSKFDKDPLRKTTVSSDVQNFKKVLYMLDGACPLKTEKVFLEGNHEHRLQKCDFGNFISVIEKVDKPPRRRKVNLSSLRIAQP